MAKLCRKKRKNPSFTKKNSLVGLPPDCHIDRFEGKFTDGKTDDEMGTLFWKTGETFVGQFKDDNFFGNGTKYLSTGEILQHGEWKGEIHSRNMFQTTEENEEFK